MMLRIVVTFLHVAVAAAWLGAALWLARDVRRTLALGRPHVDALPARARPALALDLWMGVAVIATGLVLMALGRMPPRHGIELGFAAALARFLVVLLAIRPAWRQVEAAIAGGGDLSAAEPAARRIGMLSGIAHTLWVVALVGMVFPL